MNFKKPSNSKVKDTIALTGGLVAGSMASKAVFGFMHTPTTATDAASIKKDENTALLKRGALAAVGIAAILFVDGNDTVTTLAKGTAAGVATIQILEVVKVLANRSGVESEATATSSGKKAVARALGLGCPCNTPSLNAPVTWAPRYSHSNMDGVSTEVAPLNGWGGSDEPGLLGWGQLDLQSA